MQLTSYNCNCAISIHQLVSQKVERIITNQKSGGWLRKLLIFKKIQSISATFFKKIKGIKYIIFRNVSHNLFWYFPILLYIWLLFPSHIESYFLFHHPFTISGFILRCGCVFLCVYVCVCACITLATLHSYIFLHFLKSHL